MFAYIHSCALTFVGIMPPILSIIILLVEILLKQIWQKLRCVRKYLTTECKVAL